MIVFESHFENAVKNMTRRRKIKENCNINWFNEEIRRLKREKIDKYIIAKIVNSNEAWSIYKAMRNLYKVKIQKSKNNYVNNKINILLTKKKCGRL